LKDAVQKQGGEENIAAKLFVYGGVQFITTMYVFDERGNTQDMDFYIYLITFTWS